jgi:glycosyltransferase involved in cell wall biosynthesis
MQTSQKVSVVIPAYNEGGVIGEVIERVRDVLTSSSLDHEIIVVDDGSRDTTADDARAAGARIIRHPYNIGNGAAVKRGIRQATGDVIVLMDGDGQHDPQDILRLLAHIPEYEMVVGARTKESEGQVHRNLANRFYNSLASYIAGKKVQGHRRRRREARRLPLSQRLFLSVHRHHRPLPRGSKRQIRPHQGLGPRWKKQDSPLVRRIQISPHSGSTGDLVHAS